MRDQAIRVLLLQAASRFQKSRRRAGPPEIGAASRLWRCSLRGVSAAETNSQSQPSPQPDRAVEVGRGVLFIGFAKASFMVFGALQKFLLARVASVAEYGAFSVANNAVSIVNNTVVQGTIQSVSKFTAEDDSRAGAVQRAGLKMQALLGVALALGFALAAPLMADALKAPEHTNLFRLAAAIPLLYSFYSVFVGTANGQRRFRVQASFDVGFSISKTILLLAGAVVGRSLGHPVVGAFAGFIAAALLILAVASRKMWTPAGGVFEAKRLVVFMGGVVVYTLLINLALSYDSLLLRRFAGAVVSGAAADELVGAYEAVRNLALLPYQALLVVTFVVFPLVSRSTFAEDREATRAYIRQTLRYALIFGAALAVVLAARPDTLLRLLYPASYGAGAAALPILAGGIVALALLSIAGSMITASGRPHVAVLLVAVSLVVGVGLAFALAAHAAPGVAMLKAVAGATALGMLAGFLGALAYLWRQFAAVPPLASVARVLVAVTLALVAVRLIPSQKPIMGLVGIAVAGLVFTGTLVLLREFGATDREKFARVLRRKK
jgi:O-antigen/teichoic acid export membrane protein